jgi:hypothetical protein
MTRLILVVLSLAAGLAAAPATAAVPLRMDVPQPSAVRVGQLATVRVFTYAGVRCTLNNGSARTNAPGGWMAWTFRATYAGKPAMKVWCAKGTAQSAVVRYLPVGPAGPGWKTVASYQGVADWQGPSLRIPAAEYRIGYWYSCAHNYSPFFSAIWHGTSHGTESLWREGLTGSGTWYGHQGARFGYWDIGAQGDCSWKLTVSAYY